MDDFFAAQMYAMLPEEEIEWKQTKRQRAKTEFIYLKEMHRKYVNNINQISYFHYHSASGRRSHR